MALKEQKKTEDGKKIELVCEVAAADFEKAVQRAYLRENKKINIPGFRKGKAPRHIIERMYGAGFFYEDAANDLLPDLYDEAVKSAGVEVIGRPEVSVEKMSKEEGLAVKFTTELRPELTVKKYKGISAEKTVNTVEDADVEHELGHLQERNSRMVTVDDRAAADGDTVTIDFEGFIDGKAFKGGKAKGSQLILGSHSFIDTFEEQIVGHKPGDEFDVNVTFPAEYGEKTLAGKPAVFKVKLEEIRLKELPPLDDEFAKDVSEFDTLDALKADIRKHLSEENEKRADTAFENALMEQVAETLEGEVPAAMIDDQVEDSVREFSYNMSNQGISLDTYLKYTGMTPDKLRDSLRGSAEKQVRTRLSLEAIARAEKIEATEQDLEDAYKRYADEYHMEMDKIKELLPAASLKKDIACNKAIDIVKANAKIAKPDKPKAEKPAKADKEEKPKAAKKAKKAEEPKAE